MTTESANKKCPFCAEDIKAAAIKCRFCGEMLDGTGRSATYETKLFFIPLPADSAPTRLPFGNQNQDMRIRKAEIVEMYRLAPGVELKQPVRDDATSALVWKWHIWEAWKAYFQERLNDLGRQGWQLDEVWEAFPASRWELIPPDRLVEADVSVDALFGQKRRSVIAGANFRLRRATFS